MFSHWEKSILKDDFMTASSDMGDVFYSRLTLAFLKDTNWYADVDLD